ncbi:MAG: hypothetical protein ABS69_10730 [Nitrosomonadales bacterium SCN 54-20]|nr:MAG: hypothetical protein ABS69_10730 [Nitrosomonadales bacterium SCN 54-20]
MSEYLKQYSKPNVETGCVEWTGSKNKDGYGKVGINVGKMSEKAHRAAWEIAKGRIPDELLVLHKCDNPSCINPDHLFLGTNAENMADRNAKGRQAFQKGELSGKAKLTEDQIKQIREDSRFQKDIALDYGVARTTISAIKNRYNWTHVE